MQKFTKNSLTKIGAETERTSKHNRNKDIDAERTTLNLYFKKTENGMNAEWQNALERTNATFKETKKSVAFEGIIITSDKSFFENLGYVQGQDPPQRVLEFFNPYSGILSQSDSIKRMFDKSFSIFLYSVEM